MVYVACGVVLLSWGKFIIDLIVIRRAKLALKESGVMHKIPAGSLKSL